MIFNTWTFGVFAFVTILVYWTVRPRWKRQYLVCAGIAFYTWSVPAYTLLIASLAAGTWLAGRAMLRTPEPKRKSALLALGCVLNVGVLFFFKYTHFFALTVDQIAARAILPVPHIVVPLAISFFTFEFVHVLVDIRLGKIDNLDPLDFSVFAMFFPTLVAGPIKRFQSFAPQVRQLAVPDAAELSLHFYRIAIGLVKKTVIADCMAPLVQPLLTPGAPFGRIDYWVAMLAFAVKIYFDFSGYSDIAIGTAGLLGFAIPENFERPYWAANISEFWNRWHISLSTWIRDYVFIPLGGSRRAPAIVAFNLLLALALSGLWHGAAWTFVLWGLWHGAGLVAHRIWSQAVVPNVAPLARGGRIVAAISLATTFAFVALGWVLFATPSLASARQVYANMFFP